METFTLTDLGHLLLIVILFTAVLWFTTDDRYAPTIRRALVSFIMSRWAIVPVRPGNEREQRSYAAEQGREQPGTGVREHVPDLAEQLGTCSDDELLDILSRVPGADDTYRFAESRVGRFIGGRLEERIAQVRAVRGVAEAEPPGRPLRVRDTGGERVIPFVDARRHYVEPDPELRYQDPPR